MRGVRLLVGDRVCWVGDGESLVLGPGQREGCDNGTGGDDQLRGTPFTDTIRGFAGRDSVVALAGRDLIYGGSGFDGIDAGRGDDTVDGGTSLSLPGILTVFCVIGPHPPQSILGPLGEGVTLVVPGIQNFNHSGGGDNVYIQIN
jgi:Ca2+-binding RTX toxin-like protein